MSDVLFDPWTPLSKGNTDPFALTQGPYCTELAPHGSYICTRSPGHAGFHVAAMRSQRVCCDSWGVHPDLCLPKGF